MSPRTVCPRENHYIGRRCAGRADANAGLPGRSQPEAAARHARSALDHGFDGQLDAYTHEWRDYISGCRSIPQPDSAVDETYRISAAMLRVHEDKTHRGAIVASLSFPWGGAPGEMS